MFVCFCKSLAVNINQVWHFGTGLLFNYDTFGPVDLQKINTFHTVLNFSEPHILKQKIGLTFEIASNGQLVCFIVSAIQWQILSHFSNHLTKLWLSLKWHFKKKHSARKWYLHRSLFVFFVHHSLYFIWSPSFTILSKLADWQIICWNGLKCTN